jgi:DNA-binding MarR family transcriptional regulator
MYHPAMPRKSPADEVEQAMVAIRRQQFRGRLARAAGVEPSGSKASTFLALDAAEQASTAGEPCTVSFVAESLGVDLPRASRLVARAVADGLLRRRADPVDGRRSLLEITPAGQVALDDVHTRRRALMARAMTGWTAADRQQFARLLTRFVDGLHA